MCVRARESGRADRQTWVSSRKADGGAGGGKRHGAGATEVWKCKRRPVRWWLDDVSNNRLDFNRHRWQGAVDVSLRAGASLPPAKGRAGPEPDDLGSRGSSWGTCASTARCRGGGALGRLGHSFPQTGAGSCAHRKRCFTCQNAPTPSCHPRFSHEVMCVSETAAYFRQLPPSRVGTLSRGRARDSSPSPTP